MEDFCMSKDKNIVRLNYQGMSQKTFVNEYSAHSEPLRPQLRAT